MKQKQGTILEEATIKTKAIYNQGKQDKRYSLIKEWYKKGEAVKKATVIMYNPSISSDLKTDLTVCKCLNFLIDQGFNAMEVVNLFAKRSKDPSEVKKADKIHDPLNHSFIKEAFESAEIIIVAWGSNGGKKKRDKAVLQLLSGMKKKLRALYNPKKEQVIPASVAKAIHPRNISEDTARIVLFDYDNYMTTR
jgi:hypothetical protein